MSASRFLTVVVVATIPAWYAYRTWGEMRSNRLSWSTFIPTVLKEQEFRRDGAGQDLKQECLDAVKNVEAAHDAFLADWPDYKRFIKKMLQEPPPSTARVRPGEFAQAFEWHHVPIETEKALEEKWETVHKIALRCETESIFNLALNDTVRELNWRRMEFQTSREQFLNAMSDIELIIRYANDELPNTLGGELATQRALSLLHNPGRRPGRSDY